MLMFLSKPKPTTNIEVLNHSDLVSLWKRRKEILSTLSYFGQVRVREPLTAGQRRRLPKGLRDILIEGPEPAIDSASGVKRSERNGGADAPRS